MYLHMSFCRRIIWKIEVMVIMITIKWRYMLRANCYNIADGQGYPKESLCAKKTDKIMRPGLISIFWIELALEVFFF